MTDIKRSKVSPLPYSKQFFYKRHLVVFASDAFSTELKLNFPSNLWLNTRDITNRDLWHTMGPMMDDMFSSKFMFAPNLSNSCQLCANNVQGLCVFPGKRAFFLRSRPWTVKTDRLLLDSSYRENASFTLHWAMIAGAERETSPSPESALRFTHITANVSLWAARCHSFSVEYTEGSRMHVSWGRAAERSWTASYFMQMKQTGLASKRQPTIKARVGIMTNLY